MSEDTLQKRHKKWLNAEANTGTQADAKFAREDAAAEKQHLADANSEWRKFYEAVREFTRDMR
ncbi:hypothetical protein D3C78_997140 [compost metagenome]